MKNLREEFFELLKDPKIRWLSSGSITIPTIASFWVGFQGKPHLLIITVYTLIFLFILVNSAYVFIARKKIPLLLQTTIQTGAESEVVKYPLLRPFGIGGIILSVILFIFFFFVPPINTPVIHAINGTPTLTPTQTLPPSPSAAATATHRASDDIYYVFILDASESMNETFDGQNKWNVAINAAVAILQDGSNRDAHFALYTVGGSGPNQASDPCLNPSGVDVPFGRYDEVYTRLAQLQPGGGGSFKNAFNLAKTDLQRLPRESIGSITFITSIEDSCQGGDALMDLKYAIQDLDTIDIRGEIVLLDDDGARTQEIKDYLNSLSENVNVQAPPNVQVLFSTTVQNIVVNINNFNIMEATKRAPESSYLTVPPILNTEAFTPISNPSSTSLVSLPPQQATATSTNTPPTIPTSTSTFPPPPPATDTPFVQLISPPTYLGGEVGCQIDIIVSVSGSPATGSFHVWNASYGPEGDVYTQTTLPVGTTNNLVSLGGNLPEYYVHKVWFEYDGRTSNILENLICPDLTPAP